MVLFDLVTNSSFSPHTEDEKSRPGGQVMLQSAGLRAGALVVLLVMVGSWADVMQVLLFFLGESLCLLPSLSLLRSTAPLVSESACVDGSHVSSQTENDGPGASLHDQATIL